MKFEVGILVIALAGAAFAVEPARFDNYRIYRADVKTELQLKVLRELMETSDSYSFWDEPVALDSKIDVLVAPHKFAEFAEINERYGLTVQLLNDNWQSTIDQEAQEIKRASVGVEPNNINWSSYWPVADIHAWMDQQAAAFPNWVTVSNIGQSHEGRNIKMMRISKQTGNRAIFNECQIHAREWIAGATCTYIINELLRSTNSSVQSISQTVDWYFVPIANPDGYEYSRNTNRNWRKTRTPPPSGTCVGVDGNRNFGYNWLIADETGNLGASTNPCSDTFAGPSPHSTVEAQAFDNFLRTNHARFGIYNSFHSYGHYLLYPMGNTQVQIPLQPQHAAIGNAAGNALFAVNGIRYLVGNSRTALYATSGTSVDHAVGQYNIPIGYTYEMRGNGAYGNHGFQLPASHIIPNGQEVTASLIAMVSSARSYGYL